MAQDSHSRILHEGIIFKKGQINKAWKQRWFVLYNSRRLSYFENKSSSFGTAIKTIDLSDVHSINIIPSNTNNKNNKNDESKLQRMETISVASVTDKAFSFELTTAKRTYLLSCTTLIDLNNWIDNLEKSIFGGRLHQGWLIKRGAYRKSWKKRWFVIYDTQEMRYYDDKSRKEPKGLIKLHQVLLMCPGDKDQYNQPYTIQLMTPDRNWVLATASQKERDEWFGRLEETMHGAKRLITSHEGYLWKRGQVVKAWKKRYFALSKGWLFYFEEQFHCNKFKSIAFFSEAFFNQAFRLYVKGSIPLHQTTIQKNIKNDKNHQNDEKEYVFNIITEKRRFQFATENENDLEKWFVAFHSTHNPLQRSVDNDEESQTQLTMTHDMDEEDGGEYNELLVGLKDNHSMNNLDAGNNNNMDANDDEEEEKKFTGNDDDKCVSKTPLMDIIDPKGTAKWVDIEDKIVEQQQSSVLSKSLEKSGIDGK